MAINNDIITRLLLYTKDFDAKLDKAGKDVKEFGSGVESIGQKFGKFKAGALAVWGAVGAGAVQMFNQMKEHSNRIGDVWERTIASSQGAWNQFIQSVNNADFSGFMTRVRAAAESARNLEMVQEGYTEMANSVALQKAMNAEHLSQLLIDMRDVTKSYKDREKAANEYLSIVEGWYGQEIDYRRSEAKAQVANWVTGTPVGKPLEGLEIDSESYNKTLDTIVDNFSKFIIQYDADKELADAIGTVIEKKPPREEPKKPAIYTKKNCEDWYEDLEEYKKKWADYLAAQRMLVAKSEEYGFNVFDFAQTYELMKGDKQTQPVIDSLIAYGNAQAAQNSENRRVYSVLHTAQAGAEKDKVNADKDIPAVEGSIAYLQEKLKEAKDSVLNAVSDEARAVAQATVDEIEKQISQLQYRADWQSAFKRGKLNEFVIGKDNMKLSAKDWAELDRIEPPDIDVSDIDFPVPDVSKVEDYRSQIDETSNSIGILAGAMSNLGGLVDSQAASWMSYAGNVVQAIAQAIPAITALTEAKRADANMGAAKLAADAGGSVANVPFAGPALAVAAIASVIAALAAVPKFAEGGIVGGNSYHGDRILARLNSGELVLNTDQQRRLFAHMERPVQRVEITGRMTASGRDLQYIFDKYSDYRRQ